eukprot:IDg20820t1
MRECKFVVNAFNGTANRFYLLNVRSRMSFNDRVDLMKREYDSVARKNQVQAGLESLTLPSFMATKGITSEDQGLSSWASTSLKKIGDDGMTFFKMASAPRSNLQFQLEQKGQKLSSTFNVD